MSNKPTNYGNNKNIIIAPENMRHPERCEKYVKHMMALEKENIKDRNREAKFEREWN